MRSGGGVVHIPHRAPHIAHAVIGKAGGLPFDLVFKNVLDIGGHIQFVTAALRQGEFFQHPFFRHLFDHVIGGADHVVCVTAGDLEVVVKILVGAEGGIFHVHGSIVLFRHRRLEIRDDAVADVIFPVRHFQRKRFLRGIRPSRRKRHRGDQSRKRDHCNLFHLFISLFSMIFLFVFLFARIFSTTTTAAMTAKMTAASARKAGSSDFAVFFTALYT